MLYVAQFRESVSEYAKLAGQMDGHDAENVVEAKVTNPYVIQSYYLSKEMKEKENENFFLSQRYINVIFIMCFQERFRKQKIIHFNFFLF